MDARRLFFAAALLLALPLFAANPEAGRIDAARAELIAQYESLRPLTETQRKDFILEQTPDVQSNLWILHYERFLAGHPELRAEERAVVYQALGLLRAGFFDRLYSKNDVEIAQANEDLLQLVAQIKIGMPGPVSREAFAQIDPGTPPREAFDPVKDRFGAIANSVPFCNCSTQDGYCYAGGICVSQPRSCRPTTGCGAMFTLGCDGFCF